MSALIATGGIAKMFAIDRRRAIRWSFDERFPKPISDGPNGRRWKVTDVCRFIENNCHHDPGGTLKLIRIETRRLSDFTTESAAA